MRLFFLGRFEERNSTNDLIPAPACGRPADTIQIVYVTEVSIHSLKALGTGITPLQLNP